MSVEVEQRGFTVPELARIYRVSEDKIRNWIRRGMLGAINTADARCARPRFVVLPHHLAEFERGHAAAEPPAPKGTRRKKAADFVDYYPD